MDELAFPLALLSLCLIVAMFVVAAVDGRQARRRLAAVEAELAAERLERVTERAMTKGWIETLDRMAARTGEDVVRSLKAMNDRTPCNGVPA